MYNIINYEVLYTSNNKLYKQSCKTLFEVKDYILKHNIPVYVAIAGNLLIEDEDVLDNLSWERRVQYLQIRGYEVVYFSSFRLASENP